MSENSSEKAKIVPTRLKSLEASAILNELSAFFVAVAKAEIGVDVRVSWVVLVLPIQAGIVSIVDSPKK
jgi:hypothetical protein